MPVYQYLCNECGSQADYLVPKVGQAPDGCKQCNSPELLRVMSGQVFGIGKSSKKTEATASKQFDDGLARRINAEIGEHLNHGDDIVQVVLSPNGIEVQGYVVQSEGPIKLN